MVLQTWVTPRTRRRPSWARPSRGAGDLVSLPFREEYPGGRQWNLDAAQFKYKPAELADDEVPYHPHWDMIFDHIGHELTPALRELPWAIDANIRSGADYLRSWVACAFRDPFQPLPYLFLFGPEDSGKSIFWESLGRLVTKGVVKADGALTSEFNGELSGAIICAVEETDISKAPGAHAKIKEYVTGRTISIRKMRHDSFEQPNATHWVQTANKRENCPVFPGDTRITAVYVGDLLEEQKIAKPKLEPLLDQEAPHFLHTLMHLELPPAIDRLRLPVVTTASKHAAQEENQTELGRFIAECCEQTPEQAYALQRVFRPLSAMAARRRKAHLDEEAGRGPTADAAPNRPRQRPCDIRFRPDPQAGGRGKTVTLRIYRSTGFLSRSVLRAELVAEVETDQWPEDEAAFADEYGGDIIEVVSENPGEDQ